MDTPVAWPAQPDPTGDESVDGILAELSELPELSMSGQAERYDQIHDDLLADLDAGTD
ncbi:hypothetical protein LVY72_18040 [Arthrobacter sp. I2-34]|uniref:Uncharacterized protein n=1 Tax=Arthrobacter hankyongi TaxID=2904801 RepID=A0ABS9LAT1_9MICC|nr:hypothetical protein [Arthrobacter hankyongi]MCG2623798.1 hypothetical protein [Arthrobacter hankyongi]